MFKVINEDEKLKKLFIGSWYRKQTYLLLRKQVGLHIVISSNNTGIVDNCNTVTSEKIGETPLSWDVSNGYFFYDDIRGNKIDINSKHDRNEVRELFDGIYLLVDASDNKFTKGTIDCIMISENSKWIPYLKKGLDFIDE